MDVEIRKQRIQEELKDCKSGLTVSDRRLLSTFLGYLPIEGIRDKKRIGKYLQYTYGQIYFLI